MEKNTTVNQANATARLLGYLRHLMDVDPVVRKARLSGPQHLQVSSGRKGGVVLAYLKAGRRGALPPLKVPVPLLADDTRKGYNGVKQCVYGWLETSVGAGRRAARSKSVTGGKPRQPGPLDN